MFWQIFIFHPVHRGSRCFQDYATLQDLSSAAFALHSCGVDTEIFQVMQGGRRYKIAECLANEPFEALAAIYVPKTA